MSNYYHWIITLRRDNPTTYTRLALWNKNAGGALFVDIDIPIPLNVLQFMLTH